MSRDLKYVIVWRVNIVFARAIVFNGDIVHKDMVPRGWTCESAGFCALSGTQFDDIKVTCFGRSDSLDKDSIPIFDQGIIEKTLNRTFLM